MFEKCRDLSALAFREARQEIIRKQDTPARETKVIPPNSCRLKPVYRDHIGQLEAFRDECREELGRLISMDLTYSAEFQQTNDLYNRAVILCNMVRTCPNKVVMLPMQQYELTRQAVQWAEEHCHYMQLSLV